MERCPHGPAGLIHRWAKMMTTNCESCATSLRRDLRFYMRGGGTSCIK
ncbi:hypothetical protein RB6824 [Rhodopirellula baltica SH 1]|uniref:Uncharacterized protein n=1 Tax=Rhodopirellula baltica (strain DSM 10527 / NCIMB 13988 / SH1) TaxID=243090 RepID=Q7UPN3_RHOBA|nr:hypothetical protein RB6824 [Rhodopirellula baltica SH 1]